MKKWLILFSGILIVACNSGQQEGEGAVVSGTINFPSNGYVYLEELVPDGYEVIDSVRISGGQKFSLKSRKTTHDIYRINFFNKQKQPIILGDQDLWVEADGNSQDGRFVGSGSKEMDAISYIANLQREYRTNSSLFFQKIGTAKNNKDSAAYLNLQNEVELHQTNYESAIMESVRSQQGSLTGLLILTESFEIEPYLDFYDEQMPIMKTELADSWYYNRIYDQYVDVKKVAIGSIAPDFRLPDPEGNMIDLNSMRGKYVFLDFWASWCQPCRMENPELVKVYQKFTGPDFEILGVSFDKKKENWTKAISKDKLTWIHVSDLKYFDSEMLQLYNISNVPTTFLLDPEGRIIAKNIHANELEEILARVL